MDASSQELVPIGDAARRLGVAVETLRRWANEDRLPCYRTAGGRPGQRRFKIADLDEFLDQRTQPVAEVREPQPADGIAS
jgi:excisionase family DNA binding protein